MGIRGNQGPRQSHHTQSLELFLGIHFLCKSPFDDFSLSCLRDLLFCKLSEMVPLD